MGIRAILKKAASGLKESMGIGKPEDEDADFGIEELGAESAEAPEALPEDADELPELAPELQEHEEQVLGEVSEEEAPEEPETGAEDVLTGAHEPAAEEPHTAEKTKDASKTESKIKSIESRLAYQKSEMSRFIEQVTFLNQKIDHLQEEQMELERQVKSKE